jgi:hypothetical protein
VALWLTVAVAGFLLITFAIRRRFSDLAGRIIITGIAASAIPLSIVSQVGLYDELFLFGAVLFAVLGPRLWIIGSMMMAAANPELGAVAAIGVVAVGFANEDLRVMIRGLTTLVLSLALVAGVWVTKVALGVPMQTSRLGLLEGNALRSLQANAEWLPLTLASLFLGSWILVILMCATPTHALRRFSMCVGLIAIPVTAMLLTLDGSRVGVAVAAPALVVALVNWGSHLDPRGGHSRYVEIRFPSRDADVQPRDHHPPSVCLCGRSLSELDWTVA